MPAKSSTTLTALRQRIAIRPDCIADERTTLLVQQKAAWSHGDFIARKADGTTILTSNGKVLSNSARKEFQDASGLPLFSLRRAWFSLTRHYWLELPVVKTSSPFGRNGPSVKSNSISRSATRRLRTKRR